MENHYTKVIKELREMAYLGTVLGLLGWDEQTKMPPAGARIRAEATAALAGMYHRQRTAPQFVKELRALHKNQSGLNEEQRAVVREAWRDSEREQKLPTEFVTTLSQVTSEAFMAWQEARAKADFALFLPHLQKIIELKRQEAEYVGYSGSPYNALLDLFEPQLTVHRAEAMFNELKAELVPLLKKIQAASVQLSRSRLDGDFPISQQEKLGRLIAEKLGYDFEAGRIDTAVHPFEIPIAAGDIRITVRYDEKNLAESLTSIIHETGHALYDQGMLAENYGTPLAEAVSLGVHESQSRLWENLVGKSPAFWHYFYPILQEYFPKAFTTLPEEEFYANLNAVEPGFIRVDADEVSYNLHIILRFELEKELVEGTLKTQHLPEAWNAKMAEYLGLKVPNDALGVLQDVHWSNGMIGYFPTYSIGNLYSAQLFAAAKKQLPSIEEDFSSGDFSGLREWLRKNIHIHGRRYGAEELIKQASGETPSSRYFIEYLKEKYQRLYHL